MNTIDHDQDARQFVTEVEGHRAQLDYSLAGSVMTITHTRVPSAIEGRGIAADLMRSAVKLAGERGWTIDPACSYADAYLRKHGMSSRK